MFWFGSFNLSCKGECDSPYQIITFSISSIPFQSPTQFLRITPWLHELNCVNNLVGLLRINIHEREYTLFHRGSTFHQDQVIKDSQNLRDHNRQIKSRPYMCDKSCKQCKDILPICSIILWYYSFVESKT